jgi:hypothetical protein
MVHERHAFLATLREEDTPFAVRWDASGPQLEEQVRFIPEQRTANRPESGKRRHLAGLGLADAGSHQTMPSRATPLGAATLP